MIDAAGLPDRSTGWLGDRLAEAAGVLGCSGELRVRLVRDAEMAAAHARYSGVEGTTDVLTFDLTEGGSALGEPVDADALVCVDEAARGAAEAGHGLDRELLLYALHALLHCLGHDDVTEEGFERMHAEEDRILERIGVGRTFAPRGDGGAA